MTLLHQAAQKAVEALRSLANEPDRSLQQRPQRWQAVRDAIADLESALQQQPEPVAEDPKQWKQSYFNLRHVMQDWHAQALAAGFDGVPDVLLIAAEAANLFSALNAMLTQFGMDEDEWSRPTFKRAKDAIEQYLAARKKDTAPPALQHQEVPREPVAKDVRVSDFIAGAAWHMANPDDSLDALQEAAEWWATEHASPSTTRQQEVGSGWRPIESAPKDGSEMLLSNGQIVAQGWWEHQEPYIREHRDMDGRYIDQDEHDGYDGWLDFAGGMLPEPTHWMPLPAAPSTPEKAGGVSPTFPRNVPMDPQAMRERAAGVPGTEGGA